MMDASGKNKRVTMIKSVVGKVKSAQYALPDIVYGVESKLDKEGAGKGETSRTNSFLHWFCLLRTSLLHHEYLLSTRMACLSSLHII